MSPSQNRTRVANQLHRLLRKLLAGGVPTDAVAAKAATNRHHLVLANTRDSAARR
jgi:hypothetical protein